MEQKNQKRDWYYLWALTAYANAVKEVYGSDKAKTIYSQILKIEPSYKWLKEEIINFPDFNL